MAFNYTVQPGERILDVCLNATGTIANWSKILEANSFSTWTPVLYAGQILIIPDGVEIQTNVLREMQIYPASNDPGIPDLNTQISNLINNFTPPTFAFEDDNDFIFEDEADKSFENYG
jgi:hypothetical protein